MRFNIIKSGYGEVVCRYLDRGYLKMKKIAKQKER